MKVYVVATGEYSGYHVVAVFSTKERAERFMELNRKDGRRVIPWDLMEMTIDEIWQKTELGLRPFSVSISESADNKTETQVSALDDLPELEAISLSTYTEEQIRTYPDINLNWFHWEGWARDKEHAVKIAADVRRQKIAESQLIASSSNSNSTENQP